MTDQEILEKYREKIENGVNKICKEDHIEDDSLREAVLHAYQKGFLEGFKEGREEVAKELIIDGMPLEKVCKVTKLGMEIVTELARKISREKAN